MCVCGWVGVLVWVKGTDRQKGRQTDIDKERDGRGNKKEREREQVKYCR